MGCMKAALLVSKPGFALTVAGSWLILRPIITPRHLCIGTMRFVLARKKFAN
jgi:hypothetical protein